MDFSEIGVKSRKTGLSVTHKVKKDENDMEDLDDFFKDEQTTLVSDSGPNSNGRMLFPASVNEMLRSPVMQYNTQGRQPPLLSPLPSHSHSHSYSSQRPDSKASTYEDDYGDMDLDDESTGNIKYVVSQRYLGEPLQDEDISFHEDQDRVQITSRSPSTSESPVASPLPKIQHSTPKDPRMRYRVNRSRFFVGDDSSPSKSSDSIIQERIEQLQRNTTVRSSKRKSSTLSSSAILTSDISTSAISSPIISSPHISSRSISSLTKKIALNRGGKTLPSSDSKKNSRNSRRSPFKARARKNENRASKTTRRKYLPHSDSESASDFSDNSDIPSTESEGSVIYDETVDESRIQDDSTMGDDSIMIGDEFEDEDDDLEHVRGRKRYKSDDDEKRNASQRVNKFKRESGSGVSRTSASGVREHVIDVDSLRREQESRSRSRPPEEQQVRRSSRVKIAPLAFWRNERAIYEKSAGDAFPSIKKIITVDEPAEASKPKQQTRAGSRSRATSRNLRIALRNVKDERDAKNESEDDSEIRKLEDDSNNEEDEEKDEKELEVEKGSLKGSEWLAKGYLKVETFEGHGSDAKDERLIAWAPGTENFSSSVISDTDKFKLAILFDKNKEFIATGMMLIPPDGVKSLKSTDTTYFVFYCIQGIIEVTLSGNTFLIKKGCSLEVPMGNFYQFINKGQKDAKLFFVQTKGQEPDDWDDE